MQIKISLQPEIYEKVKENAKENMRTMSGEINYMLNKAYSSSTPDSTSSAPRRRREIIDNYPTENRKEEELINDPYYDPNF